MLFMIHFLEMATQGWYKTSIPCDDGLLTQHILAGWIIYIMFLQNPKSQEGCVRQSPKSHLSQQSWQSKCQMNSALLVSVLFKCNCCAKEKKLICALFQAKIQTIQGYARFINDAEPTVEVNGRKYTAPHILIATGGQPSVLSDAEVPGKTCYTLFYQWASVRCVEDDSCCVCWQFQGQAWALPVMASLNLKHCQSKLVIHTDVNGRPSEPCRSVIIVFVFSYRRSLVVGAGYIAVEMAGILSTLGSKTSLIIRQTGVRKMTTQNHNMTVLRSVEPCGHMCTLVFCL